MNKSKCIEPLLRVFLGLESLPHVRLHFRNHLAKRQAVIVQLEWFCVVLSSSESSDQGHAREETGKCIAGMDAASTGIALRPCPSRSGLA